MTCLIRTPISLFIGTCRHAALPRNFGSSCALLKAISLM